LRPESLKAVDPYRLCESRARTSSRVAVVREESRMQADQRSSTNRNPASAGQTGLTVRPYQVVCRKPGQGLFASTMFGSASSRLDDTGTLWAAIRSTTTMTAFSSRPATSNARGGRPSPMLQPADGRFVALISLRVVATTCAIYGRKIRAKTWAGLLISPSRGLGESNGVW
jgi:hypothetical protein